MSFHRIARRSDGSSVNPAAPQPRGPVKLETRRQGRPVVLQAWQCGANGGEIGRRNTFPFPAKVCATRPDMADQRASLRRVRQRVPSERMQKIRHRSPARIESQMGRSSTRTVRTRARVLERGQSAGPTCVSGGGSGEVEGTRTINPTRLARRIHSNKSRREEIFGPVASFGEI